MTDCIFCGIIAGEIPADIVHQTERTLAFRDINPAAPVHVLIVPRTHIDDASALGPSMPTTWLAMLVAAREVAEAEGIGVPERATGSSSTSAPMP